MSISFLIFLVIIGITSIYQISNVNSKVMELNDLSMTPIMELESIKSNVEYIRSECIALMNSSDDETFKSIQSEIDATTTSVDESLLKYKDDR